MILLIYWIFENFITLRQIYLNVVIIVGILVIWTTLNEMIVRWVTLICPLIHLSIDYFSTDCFPTGIFAHWVNCPLIISPFIFLPTDYLPTNIFEKKIFIFENFAGAQLHDIKIIWLSFIFLLRLVSGGNRTHVPNFWSVS